MRLADMGLAKPIELVKGTLCGTLWYMAPEVFLEKPYTEQVDMFSFGIIMWELWHKKRVYEVTRAPPLQLFLKMVETGKLRPGDGQFIGEGISYGTLSRSQHNQQPKLATAVDVPQTTIKSWADVARTCWLSNFDSRLSAYTTHEKISALSVGSDE